MAATSASVAAPAIGSGNSGVCLTSCAAEGAGVADTLAGGV